MINIIFSAWDAQYTESLLSQQLTGISMASDMEFVLFHSTDLSLDTIREIAPNVTKVYNLRQLHQGIGYDESTILFVVEDLLTDLLRQRNGIGNLIMLNTYLNTDGSETKLYDFIQDMIGECDKYDRVLVKYTPMYEQSSIRVKNLAVLHMIIENLQPKRVQHIITDPNEYLFEMYGKDITRYSMFSFKEDITTNNGNVLPVIYFPCTALYWSLHRNDYLPVEKKENQFAFGMTAMTKSNPERLELIGRLKYLNGIDGYKFTHRSYLRNESDGNNVMNDTGYMLFPEYMYMIARSKYTMVTRSYNKYAFSGCRMMDALAVGCIPLFTEDANQEHLCYNSKIFKTDIAISEVESSLISLTVPDEMIERIPDFFKNHKVASSLDGYLGFMRDSLLRHPMVSNFETKELIKYLKPFSDDLRKIYNND